jgi:hypothetical protein
MYWATTTKSHQDRLGIIDHIKKVKSVKREGCK